MSHSVGISGRSDSLCVWQSRPVEQDESPSSFYDHIEKKVLSARAILSRNECCAHVADSLSATLQTVVETAKSASEIAHEVLSTAVEVLSKFAGDLPRLANGVRMISVVSVPSSFITLINNSYLAIYSSGKARVNALLNAMEDAGAAITNTTIFVQGLQGLGAVAETAFQWSGMLSLAASVFSGASIYINVRRYGKMQRLGAKLDKAVDLTAKKGQATLDDYRAFLKTFEKKIDKHPEYLKDVFHFDAQQVAGRLIDIEQQAKEMLLSSDPAMQKQGQQLLYNTMQTLRGRVKHNAIASTLAATAAVVGIVGSIIFVACPLVPAGLGVSAFGSLLGVGQFVHQRVIDYQFMQQIGVERQWYEWITC